MAQQYSLRWNNHQPNFISQFTSLLNTQTLVDVTLCADGVQLLAHKVVLSACSSYFQTLFVDHPASHPIVILKDVTYTDLRTLVDFMYCGQINVTEEELPQVLATAKLLKIKGLHEMPDSTCLLRSHAPATEFPHQGDSVDSVRDSPATSPSSRRRRRRRSSAGSTQLNVVETVEADHSRADVAAQTVEAITLSSVSSACSSGPTQRRPREYNQIRTIDNSQQVDDTTEQETMNVDNIGIDTSSPITLSSASASESSADGWRRRSKHFKRQKRVRDELSIRKQTSEPIPSTAARSESPPLETTTIKPNRTKLAGQPRLTDHISSVMMKGVLVETQTSTRPCASLTTNRGPLNSRAGDANPSSQKPRASHTPTIRTGPPLSCNFCWNTVDECGRILRRKTQYHCPECRTNLCIVPCFHEYHDGPESDNNANAR